MQIGSFVLLPLCEPLRVSRGFICMQTTLHYRAGSCKLLTPVVGCCWATPCWDTQAFVANQGLLPFLDESNPDLILSVDFFIRL